MDDTSLPIYFEECDDNNLSKGDGCGNDCMIEEGFECGASFPSICDTVCGDGI
jgi:cysteine-rich repeat protein